MSAEIPPPVKDAPRYTPYPLPAYRFVAGLHPHPTRDPRGHSYGRRAAAAAPTAWQPDQWPALGPWLYGVDLFNAHFFWEAHEAWEELWASTKREALAGRLLQGLIQIAAALVKAHAGSVLGALSLSRQGLEQIRGVAAARAELMGLDLRAVVASGEAYFAPLDHGRLPEIADAPQLELGGAG